MSDDSNSIGKTTALKRRVRFSLRTIFVAISIATILFGYVFGRARNERLAAEAIAAASGTIVYDWQIRPLGSDPSTELTPPGPKWLRQYFGPHWFDQIVHVRLNEYRTVNRNNDFSVVGPHLANLPALRVLSLSGGEVNLHECELIGQLAQLEELSLMPTSVLEPDHMAAIAGAQKLKLLRLRYAKTSAVALGKLSAIPGLEEIDISCDSYDSQTGMKLEEYFLVDESARAIATFPSLRRIKLFHTRVTDDAIEALSDLSELETLIVSSPHVTSSSFEHVSKLKHLRQLGTWAWKIDHADFPKLGPMPSLVNLDLMTHLSDDSVAQLVRFTELETLRIRGKQVTEESVPHFCKLHNLVRLDLSDTGISKNSAGAVMLKRSLPACRIRLPSTKRENAIKRQFNDWKLRSSQ